MKALLIVGDEVEEKLNLSGAKASYRGADKKCKHKASRHTCIIINHIKKKKTVIEVKKEKTKHSGAYELELKNEGVNELRGATEAE